MVLYSLYLMAILLAVAYAVMASKAEWIVKDVGAISRFPTLDGLRGLCASSVFIHHSVMAYGFYAAGKWKPVSGVSSYDGNYMGHLGSVGVMLFFMVTGFLFSDRLIRNSGREDWVGFYRKRIRRIAPLYFFVVLTVIAICVISDAIKGSFLVGYGQALQWFGFGFFPLSSLGMTGFTWTMVCGVLWTLAIEWQFYFLLPAIGVFCTRNRTFLTFVGAVSVLSVMLALSKGIEVKTAVIALCFCAGAIAAHLHSTPWRKHLASWPMAVLSVALLAIDIKYRFSSYNLLSFLSVALIFLCASNGNSFFGILNFRPMKFLGVISYSVYLCHGLVLFGASKAVSLGMSQYAMLAALLLVPFCALTYRYVERPFLSQREPGPSISSPASATAL
ncbi:acyltransferase family protein [Pseudomonas caricapapayae]|uniref:Acyltransferase family protein n=1 Tax=Pseudomonas caricapapayae TaxID=46678 RepID=A0ACC7LNW8_9PSED